MMSCCDVGLIGLAVMGQNLALNIASKGFRIAVYNRTSSKVEDTLKRAKDEGSLPVEGYHELKDFVNAIKTPRKIIILVKAGAAVDAVLDALSPLLSRGDVVVDGGNEWYELTEARTRRMESMGFHYLGMGVSGGEEGARHGPALMPGGSREAYTMIQPIVEKIAAYADDKPCVSYIGPGGAGNYVKMVHNGIEYGDMELIAETYNILKQLNGLSHEQLHATFTSWNKGELQSYLIEITADIFCKKDDQGTQGYILDAILDVAGSKGTGMWTVQEASRRGIPCPTIQAALDMRYMSAMKTDRSRAAEVYPRETLKEALSLSKDDIKDALYCSKICSYAQGMMLLRRASEDHHWSLNLSEIARGWKGGCIIRAQLLDKIRKAFQKNPDLPSLLLDSEFANELRTRLPGWRRVVTVALQAQIAVPAFAASLTYFDMFSSKNLPVNLVQAQRDYFGAHTYSRVDKEGVFHTNWK